MKIIFLSSITKLSSVTAKPLFFATQIVQFLYFLMSRLRFYHHVAGQLCFSLTQHQADCSPYGSASYLSPPPDTSWRRYVLQNLSCREITEWKMFDDNLWIIDDNLRVITHVRRTGIVLSIYRKQSCRSAVKLTAQQINAFVFTLQKNCHDVIHQNIL